MSLSPSPSMSRAAPSREALLAAARRLFWSRGYAAVGLREIAGEAGVDAALVSRHFGGKRELFAATLDGAMEMPELFLGGAEALEEAAVAMCLVPPEAEAPSLIRMILANADDPEVGELVRARFVEALLAPAAERLGGARRASLLAAVLLGMSVAQKTLRLPGLPPAGDPETEAALRHMIRAALSFEQERGGEGTRG